MKLPKRLLAILLALALAFTLALPAFADAEPDPAMPEEVIAVQENELDSAGLTQAEPIALGDDDALDPPDDPEPPDNPGTPDDPGGSRWDGAWDRAREFLLLLFAETPFYGIAWVLITLFAPVTFPFMFFFPFGFLILPMFILAPVIWPVVLIIQFLGIFGISF